MILTEKKTYYSGLKSKNPPTEEISNQWFQLIKYEIYLIIRSTDMI